MLVMVNDVVGVVIIVVVVLVFLLLFLLFLLVVPLLMFSASLAFPGRRSRWRRAER